MTSVTAEIAARLDQPLGNLVFTRDGRLFVIHHPMFETAVRVSEVVDGALRPFPDASWNSTEPPPGGAPGHAVAGRSDLRTRRDAVCDGGATALAAPLNHGKRGDVQPHLLVRTRPLAPGQVG